METVTNNLKVYYPLNQQKLASYQQSNNCLVGLILNVVYSNPVRRYKGEQT